MYIVKNGFDSILIDVGDAVRYKSHPEIAVEGAWSPEFMNQEVKRLKKWDLRFIPSSIFRPAMMRGWVNTAECFYIHIL